MCFDAQSALLPPILRSKSHLFPSYHPLPPPSFYFIVSACRSLPLPAHFWKIEAFSSLSLSPGSILLRFPLSPLGSRSFAICRDGRKWGISGFALREKKAYPFFHLFFDFSGTYQVYSSSRRLFFSTLGRDLFSANVSVLRAAAAALSRGDTGTVFLDAAAVQTVGRRRKGGADAMTADDRGNVYFGLLAEG